MSGEGWLNGAAFSCRSLIRNFTPGFLMASLFTVYSTAISAKGHDGQLLSREPVPMPPEDITAIARHFPVIE